MSILSGIAHTFGSMFGVEQAKNQAEANRINADIALTQNRLSQEAFDYQKNYNALTMDREDNAYSRASADLQNAGLSKTLAAGQSSPVGTSSAPSAPQLSQYNYKNSPAYGFDALNMVNSAMGLVKDLQVKDAQVSQIMAQKSNIDADTLLKEKTADIMVPDFDKRMQSADSNINLNSHQVKKLTQEVENLKQDLIKSKAQTSNISQDTRKKMFESAQISLENDLYGAKKEGLRLSNANLDVIRQLNQKDLTTYEKRMWFELANQTMRTAISGYNSIRGGGGKANPIGFMFD